MIQYQVVGERLGSQEADGLAARLDVTGLFGFETGLAALPRSGYVEAPKPFRTLAMASIRKATKASRSDSEAGASVMCGIRCSEPPPGVSPT